MVPHRKVKYSSFRLFILPLFIIALLLVTLYGVLLRHDTTVRAAVSGVRRTFYVSTKGIDTNPGTIEAPFRTIGKAALIVNPGDTVLIRGGYLQSSS
ncbi:hypothetical protein A3A84_01405 [Candidatus Collierbacteria bacterium RIFCSPLOWO2_01_FULL_50_23]|uniref:DUF1565 domain-containing protein n=1 Tax=Candidatus Collierbacteria bacterium RIFCSPHIGHO2_01_FULL_50_25 TaxID=1817722 RepID=A0A1F5EYJ2_9BACT|nr:MAG: hypothetical protein A2703_01810 [Candidatus Collierbacteria bacterium RIFCSPHIGHO2_01_FULL_50_25]OGD75056.1 MAG: hypothetical protein A3A84_01405 [Candidatus Collierbacteria bacterium RIFCSPLOWO2_01_FULL_50_23]